MGERFEKLLVEQCAPTLAGIKPASLFRVGEGDAREIFRVVDFWDRQLRGMGLRILVLKECPRTGACLIYLFRQAWLEKILQRESIRAFLQRVGYTLRDTLGILRQLAGRFCAELEYPHEIGVFLGYPLRDVIGFIENQGRNYTCCGCWKCYGDPDAARRCFERYRSCTARLKQLHAEGVPVVRMVAAA